MNRTNRWRSIAYLAVLAVLGASGASAISGKCAPTRSMEANSVMQGNTGKRDYNAMKNRDNPGAPSSFDARLVAANTRFGFKLYEELLKGSADRNILISPASVAMALAMTYNGAGGATKEAMARALDFEGLSLEEVNRASAELEKSLEKPDPGVQLQIANSLWARKGMSFNPGFLSRNTEFFGAQVSELDFNDPSAPARINAWVSGKTNGKIPQIIDRIRADAILFLINAIYFKGKWADPFDKALTKDEPFYPAAGGEKKLPMMHRRGRYPYFETGDFQAIRLPYGGGKWSMLVFLPAKGSSLKRFQQSLNASTWDSWMTRFDQTNGEIALPRFKVEYAAELNAALKDLGMGVAFEPQAADFKNMIQSQGKVFINQVRHKTYADVNEEGTEAAAATSVGISLTAAAPRREPFRMIVDRPFFWAIRDNESGELLFVASIVDPQ